MAPQKIEEDWLNEVASDPTIDKQAAAQETGFADFDKPGKSNEPVASSGMSDANLSFRDKYPTDGMYVQYGSNLKNASAGVWHPNNDDIENSFDLDKIIPGNGDTKMKSVSAKTGSIEIKRTARGIPEEGISINKKEVISNIIESDGAEGKIRAGTINKIAQELYASVDETAVSNAIDDIEEQGHEVDPSYKKFYEKEESKKVADKEIEVKESKKTAQTPLEPGQVVTPTSDTSKEYTIVEQTPEGKTKVKTETGEEIEMDPTQLQAKVSDKKTASNIDVDVIASAIIESYGPDKTELVGDKYEIYDMSLAKEWINKNLENNGVMLTGTERDDIFAAVERKRSTFTKKDSKKKSTFDFTLMAEDIEGRLGKEISQDSLNDYLSTTMPSWIDVSPEDNDRISEALHERGIEIREASIEKKGIVQEFPGHKNSKGEDAPWCVISHDTGKILSSHKTKLDADEHLKQMKIHKEDKKMGYTKLDTKKVADEDKIKVDKKEKDEKVEDEKPSSDQIPAQSGGIQSDDVGGGEGIIYRDFVKDFLSSEDIAPLFVKKLVERGISQESLSKLEAKIGSSISELMPETITDEWVKNGSALKLGTALIEVIYQK